MDRRSWIARGAGATLLVGVVVVAGCSDGSGMSTDSQATKRAQSQTANPDFQFTSVAQAASFLSQNAGLDAPVPALPKGTKLSKGGVDISTVEGKTSAYIHVILPNGKTLALEYGRAGFDGCEVPHPRAVTVGGTPGVISSHQLTTNRGGPYSTVVWPATKKDLQGRYGVSGDIGAEQALALAKSMAKTPPAGKPAKRPGC